MDAMTILLYSGSWPLKWVHIRAFVLRSESIVPIWYSLLSSFINHIICITIKVLRSLHWFLNIYYYTLELCICLFKWITDLFAYMDNVRNHDSLQAFSRGGWAQFLVW